MGLVPLLHPNRGPTPPLPNQGHLQYLVTRPTGSRRLLESRETVGFRTGVPGRCRGQSPLGPRADPVTFGLPVRVQDPGSTGEGKPWMVG